MDSLELSHEEEEVLDELLHSAISDLRAEIAQTDSPDFKDRLRERKDILKKIALRLEALHPVHSA
ncbi:MAG: hypothetical protein GF344_07420 [Chitinivibrionales bacterium]|nr:hypothetical protein [Chitinivibrionales bacterium]MBD3356737.1 hypothetical protein [Chitinivibrionales bacterium]